MTSHILPATSKRVEQHTKQHINERIKQETIIRISHALKEDNEQLTNRIKQLDREWDTERILETNAMILVLASILLTYLFSPWWLLLAAAVAALLLQHALQGWCPPLPIIRSMGKRTAYEISLEKTALKYIRGDFNFKSNNAREIFENCNLIE